ncbi:hypothetical protein PCASD_05797 [Puccinia coronata f. sp. avenae]|uniref:Uncharacterized protein n=1 Tax=Puccinia coronata f. sp. avenae TaxID=200324 RepID=A0A2N5V1S3_9BASI|nr:hypothetical protein PCASD_05797 [Puccinia coronata f. sp. avenae]
MATELATSHFPKPAKGASPKLLYRIKVPHLLIQFRNTQLAQDTLDSGGARSSSSGGLFAISVSFLFYIFA